ncbi:MAG: dTDP-glucose 4,6-dehydratase [bacterium]|nr:dTDP-glucose 4,6-dehydratase [bacterium]
MKKTGKRILVTGGYGFMGSNFVRFLYEKYPLYQIFNFDALTYAGNTDNLQDIEHAEVRRPLSGRRYVFLKGDISDTRSVASIFATHTFDAVVHLAAESHVDRSIHSVVDFIRTNVEGTRILLDAAREQGVPRLIHLSTDEVYGNVLKGFSKENAPLNPSNPYAASKAAGDFLVQSYVRTHRFPAIIVRPSNNYGPYQYPEKLIPLGITNLLEGKKIPIHGNGAHVRSWLHTEDFCSALDIILHKAPVGEIYNIDGVHLTNLEILGLVAGHLGKKISRHIIFTPDRPGADMRYAPDASKLKRDLGWKPKHNPRTAVPFVVDWYLKNDIWWRKIRQTQAFNDQYQKQSRGRWG